MKILELIFDLSSGGGERFVTDLSNELADSENEVLLVTIKDDRINPEVRQFYRQELSENVRYVNLHCADGFSLITLFRIYRAIKVANPDVLHIHLEPIVKFCFPSIILLNRKMTIVQTIHTDFDAGHDSLLYKLIFKTVGKKHKMHWVALSPSNFKSIKARYPYLDVECIPNGRKAVAKSADFELVKTEINILRKTSETAIYLHVARCVTVKNQQMLVNAFNEFAERHCAELVIIGSGFDSSLGQKISAEAGPHIHFAGTRKNVCDYLLCCDFFCLSSLYEGLPITAIEAVLSGTPLVCTPLDGVKDITADNGNAIFSSDFSERAYLAALEESFVYREALQSNASEQAGCPELLMNTCAQKYLSFFQRVK